MTIPKGMILLGFTSEYAIYESKRGIIYHYHGRRVEDFRNPKYWERAYDSRSKKSIALQMLEQERRKMKKVA